ncbi:MAG: hypothetical protein NC320_01920 [Clostridium sp.]|nr:hypothetical protein [Clostridium sp.]
MKNKLPVTEELDFHYLLSLMPPLKGVPEFQWLPELFSIVGYESLITLCKFAGGETIKIPTIEELSDCIEALQCFYDLHIKHIITESVIPLNLKALVDKIKEVYDADNS